MKLLLESSDQAEKFATMYDKLYTANQLPPEVDQILDKYDDPNGSSPAFTDEIFDMASDEDKQRLMELVDVGLEPELGDPGYCKSLYEEALKNSYDNYYKGIVDFVEAAKKEKLFNWMNW